MSFQDYRGSSFAEWLLPIIPVGAHLTPNSKIAENNLGKIPGLRYPTGWAGLAGWTKLAGAKDNALVVWDSWYVPNPPIIGIRSKRFPGIDADVNEDWQADIVQNVAFEVFGETCVRGRSDGAPRRLLMYRLDERSAIPIVKYRRTYQVGDSEPFTIEILGDGQQYLIEGAHKAGGIYQWSGGTTPLGYGCENVPRITGDQVMGFVKALDEAFANPFINAVPVRPKGMRGDGGAGADAKPVDDDHPERAHDLGELTRALEFLRVTDPRLEERDPWEVVSRAIKTACGGDEAFYDQVYLPWQLENPDNEEDYIRGRWESHTTSSVGFGHVARLAETLGFIPSGAGLFEPLGEDDATVPTAGVGVGREDGDGDPVGGIKSDDTLPHSNGPTGSQRPADQERVIADRFVAAHALKEWIYVPMSRSGGVWKHFENGLWRDDWSGPTHQVGGACADIGDMIRCDVRATKEDLSRARWLSSTNAAEAVTRMVRANPAIKVPRLNLDAQPIVMGVPGGYVDRYGRLCDPDPTLLITRSAAFAPDASVECPRFDALAWRLANNDADTYLSLRSALGYTMTGTGRELKFFFMHGQNGNEGKSSFLHCVARVMGEYSAVLPNGAFVAHRGGSDQRFSFGGLEGAWMAYTNESERDEQWATARLKDATSGADMWIERKGVDGISIPIHFSLWFQGNFLPRFDRPDEALRKRLVIFECKLPFAKSEEQGGWCDEVFETEGAGIVAWLLQARVDYLREGRLYIAPSMIAHRDKYLDEQDVMRAFIQATLQVKPGARVLVRDVYALWRMWGESEGLAHQAIGSSASFSKALRSHPLISPHRVNTRLLGPKHARGMEFTGLEIAGDDGDEDITPLA